MNSENIRLEAPIEAYLSKYPDEIKSLFMKLRAIVFSSCPCDITEKLWAKLPSFYHCDSFVRLIPFKDHINIEASAIITAKDIPQGYKLTPKGMLQIGINQSIPEDFLRIVFAETLK